MVSFILFSQRLKVDGTGFGRLKEAEKFTKRLSTDPLNKLREIHD